MNYELTKAERVNDISVNVTLTVWDDTVSHGLSLQKAINAVLQAVGAQDEEDSRG